MVLLLFALVAIVIALARGGDLTQLARVRFRYGWTALLALALQILIFSGFWSNSTFASLTPIVYVVTMALLVLVLALNWRLPGFALIGLGLLSNTLVIGLNGGMMPASEAALRAAGLEDVALKAGALGSSANSVLIGAHTKLPFLADIIPLPRWFPFANVISIGDVLIALGAAWFFLAVIKPKPAA